VGSQNQCEIGTAIALVRGESTHKGDAMSRSHSHLERDQLYSQIAMLLGVPRYEIRPEASLQRDFGADSLDTVELVDQLERNFDVDIPDDDLSTIETIADIERYMFQ
jgi:acyl carrier protein